MNIKYTRNLSRRLVKGIALSALVSFGIGLSGCEKDPPAEIPSTDVSPDQPKDSTISDEVVSVATDGSRFDPGVPVARIPDDVWMCEMDGKSHYASKSKGDGKCPVCSMTLVHKGKHGSEHQKMDHADGMDHGDHDAHQNHQEHE